MTAAGFFFGAGNEKKISSRVQLVSLSFFPPFSFSLSAAYLIGQVPYLILDTMTMPSWACMLGWGGSISVFPCMLQLCALFIL